MESDDRIEAKRTIQRRPRRSLFRMKPVQAVAFSHDDCHYRYRFTYRYSVLLSLSLVRLQKGDKVLLPPSAFDTLVRLQVDYPMLFQLNSNNGRHTHSGVLEFTAEEGCVYIPFG
jgi:hypothetical protein